MKLVVMGPQGSGKGTQAMLLANKLRIEAISTGELLRKNIAGKTPLGLEAESYVTAGKLVPDDINNKLVEETVKKYEKGFILDGYPRNLVQAKFLDTIERLDRVVLLRISDEEATRRMIMRRYCPHCGANYNLAYVKTHLEGMCDHCHTELKQRNDDTPAIIKKRLAVYHENTEPVAEFYKENGILMEVDGERAIKDVFAEIVRRIRTKT
ncbi:MAG: adenylate kinase [Candidatus Woesearchaeota archaeon]